MEHTPLVSQKAVKENSFSKHDNRHAFQNCGVYFGQVTRSLAIKSLIMCVIGAREEASDQEEKPADL